MANMRADKVAMPEQAPDIRNKNFEEVALGYTPEMAVEEAKRCLNCKNRPCVQGCPQESQCEKYCVRGIKGEPVAIGRLERFAADWARSHAEKKSFEIKKNGHKCAVVGAGPAGPVLCGRSCADGL